MTVQQLRSPIRFGTYVFNPGCGELRKNGHKLRLPAQAIQVLGILLERPGELVTREQLNARLWPNGTIVEFDHGINACVRRLRAVLSDSAEQPRYIETLPKRGYRFIFRCDPVVCATNIPNALPAATAAQYRIVSKLGAGSMGVVYRATETRLGRDVALKMPAEELLENKPLLEAFARESRAAAALNHPNICTVFGAGEQDGRPFIAMELLDGETLEQWIHDREPAIDEVMSVALQVAAALSAAHARGIVHRDIKPSNIFVLAGNVVKVLDFGVAKFPIQGTTRVTSGRAACGRSGPSSPSQSFTFSGVRAGTLPYMAPEQLQGCPSDPRSDIFSLGVVLYEMITRRKPFEGETAEALLAAITSAPPRPMREARANVPPLLEQVVGRCLQRDPAARWQTPQEIALQLTPLTQVHASPQIEARRISAGRWMWSAVAAAACAGLIGGGVLYLHTSEAKSINSIAVIPFTSATPAAEYLSDGITESIINNLAAASPLKVTARTAAFRLKGREFEPQRIGRELGVEVVLTGRVVQRGNSLAVQTDLVRVSDGTQLWGEQFAGTASDPQNLQNQISRDVTEKLRLKLTDDQQKRLVKRYTVNSEAYQLYLKGIHTAPLRNHMDSMNAVLERIEYLHQAVLRDQAFAAAYVALAESYYALGASRYSPGRVVFEKQRQAAKTALQLDDGLGEAHLQLALALWNLDWDWSGADKEFKRAIDLNTDSAHAHYGIFLMQLGRRQEALACAERALELDPISERTAIRVAKIQSMARMNEQVLQSARRIARGEPSFLVAFTLAQMGRDEQSISEFIRIGGHGPAPRGHLAYVYARSGRMAEAQRILRELQAQQQEAVGAYEIAFIHGALGNKDQAFKWLDKAYEQRDPGLTYLKTDHTLDSLRSDPRFRELERRVGLLQ
jgi:serine/threonine-protein kinase